MPSFTARKILVIEDDPDIADLVRREQSGRFVMDL